MTLVATFERLDISMLIYIVDRAINLYNCQAIIHLLAPVLLQITHY